LLDEVMDMIRALNRCGRSLSAPVRHGRRETIGMRMDRLPDQVALTIALRETFSLHSPAQHLRESVEAAEKAQREDIELLYNYLDLIPAQTLSADQQYNPRKTGTVRGPASSPHLRRRKA
jgi:hypothetical protein